MVGLEGNDGKPSPTGPLLNALTHFIPSGKPRREPNEAPIVGQLSLATKMLVGSDCKSRGGRDKSLDAFSVVVAHLCCSVEYDGYNKYSIHSNTSLPKVSSNNIVISRMAESASSSKVLTTEGTQHFGSRGKGDASHPISTDGTLH